LQKVAIEKVFKPLSAIKSALKKIKYQDIIKKDDTIFLKPNLTWPVYKPGVTTSPSVLESTIKLLKNRCSKIILGESSAARYAWESEKCFKGHGIDKMCSRYGVDLVNLTKKPYISKTVPVCGIDVTIKASKYILDKVDKYVTLPVMKCHVATYLTLSLKNQWGAIPDPNRLLYHPFLNPGIIAINKIYDPKLVIMDGIFGLDGPGPIHGNPVKLNRIICGNNALATDIVASNYMNVDIKKVKHLQIAIKDHIGPRNLKNIEIFGDLNGKHKFRMYRTPYDSVAVFIMYHRPFNNLIYGSWWSKYFDIFLDIIRKLTGSSESY
jgi:uncharacterized protein (DUF362 family)